MKILIATDGQKYSDEAVRFAGLLFQKAGPDITIVHVHPDEDARETKKECKIYLDNAQATLEKFGLSAKTKMVEGEIVEELLVEMKEGNYDLLVLGSKGVSRVLSAVAENVLRKSTLKLAERINSAIMIVKNPPNVINQVLVCTDGSPFIEQAIDFWGRLPKVNEPRVVVLNIIPELFSGFSSELKSVTPDLLKVLSKVPGSRTAVVNRARDILERYGIEVKTKLREREYAAEEILKEEKEVDYDLIVMGYRGAKYRGVQAAGSQALAVAMQSQTSVLIYQPRVKNSKNGKGPTLRMPNSLRNK